MKDAPRSSQIGRYIQERINNQMDELFQDFISGNTIASTSNVDCSFTLDKIKEAEAVLSKFTPPPVFRICGADIEDTYEVNPDVLRELTYLPLPKNVKVLITPNHKKVSLAGALRALGFDAEVMEPLPPENKDGDSESNAG